MSETTTQISAELRAAVHAHFGAPVLGESAAAAEKVSLTLPRFMECTPDGDTARYSNAGLPPASLP